MNTEREPKAPTKATGRRYTSVAEMLREQGANKETLGRLAELEKETRVTRQLACLRTSAGLTQEEMAGRIGCTQGCISKWESGQDEELTLKVIKDYCQITEQRVGLIMGKPVTHVEAVKMHAWGLRRHLTALAAIAHGDGDLEQAIQAFFGEAFFNLLDIFEKCQREMPGSSEFEIRLEVQGSHSRQSVAQMTENKCSEPVGV